MNRKPRLSWVSESSAPLLSLLRRHESDTVGIDIEPVAVESPIGIRHICFPFKAHAQYQDAVVAFALKYAPQLIVINSTVVP